MVDPYMSGAWYEHVNYRWPVIVYSSTRSSRC